MIDTKELRRLAQAALIGPDGVSPNWLKLLQDFQKEANPAAVSELLDRLEAAEKERDALRAKIARMEQQEPVAWRTFDGEGGYDYRSYEDNENYKLGWDARNPNHIGWVEPLYALPGAKGECNVATN